MTRWQSYNPGRKAQRLVDAIHGGSVFTVGQWCAWCETVADLPTPLQIWVFDQLRPPLGDEAICYHSNKIPPRPRPVPAGVQ